LSSKDRSDVTTGVYSQRYFVEWVAATLAVQAPQRSPVSVVRFDVHDLEQVNGSFGHRVGDAVLRIVSTAVQRLIHPKDVLARHGGDKFVVLARGISVRNAAILAERIRRTVEDLPLITQGKKFRVTVSVGVAWASASEPQRVWALVETAERAVCDAKSSGRNRINIAILDDMTEA
jgi:diguanylate cyclase (GGDEF)-like protein